MVEVDKSTKTISLYQGDTGEVTIYPKGYDFSPEDRALFTVRDKKKTVVMERLLPIEGGSVIIAFAHKDTNQWTPGEYKWDIRWLVGPEYENEALDDAHEVDTPKSEFLLLIRDTVGKF